MPDDVGGKPFQDGWEPDDDRGGADEDFASVVFDEDFVRNAEVHEPTAVERLLAAAQARAEAEAARARARGLAADEDLYDDGYGPDVTGEYGYGRYPDDEHCPADPDDDAYGPYGGSLRPYRGSARWHRPVAWLLALLMGIGMVALAFTAVYRGAAANRQDQIPPPATTGIDQPAPADPSASPEFSAPAVPAEPRRP
ncbi:SCO2584 family spore wall biosynthesis protein [Streptomyces sp. SYSU K21746]